MAVIVKSPPTAFLDGHKAFLITNNKVPYTCRVNDRTSLVVFAEFHHAFTIAQLLEYHYVENKVWPDITNPPGRLRLNTHIKPRYLRVSPIYVQSIFEECLKKNVSACIIEDIIENGDDNLVIRSNMLDIYPSPEDFKTTLEDIYLG